MAAHHSIVVSFAVVVFPTVEALNHLVAPRLASLPPLVRDVLMVFTMCVTLSFAIPVVSRFARGWLSS